jgi:hypothetical protein
MHLWSWPAVKSTIGNVTADRPSGFLWGHCFAQRRHIAYSGAISVNAGYSIKNGPATLKALSVYRLALCGSVYVTMYLESKILIKLSRIVYCYFIQWIYRHDVLEHPKFPVCLEIHSIRRLHFENSNGTHLLTVVERRLSAAMHSYD